MGYICDQIQDTFFTVFQHLQQKQYCLDIIIIKIKHISEPKKKKASETFSKKTFFLIEISPLMCLFFFLLNK